MRRKMKIIATIEARMNATRLPGKMALELAPGLPALGAVIERLKACRDVDGIVVATTTSEADSPLCGIASQFGAQFFRGSEEDVLGRVVGAGREAGADTLVLVTGDCSCVSPGLIDEGVDFFLKNSYDLVTNCLEQGYPTGIDMQVVRFASLEKSYDMARETPYKDDKNNFEHVNFFMKNHPDIFRIYNYPPPDRHRRPDIQLALDSAADLEVMRKIYSRLYSKDRVFETDDILGLIDREPETMKALENRKMNRLGY